MSTRWSRVCSACSSRLVDASAWVDFDRATGSAAHRRLADLIREGGVDVVVSEPVLGEVLAGARTEGDARRLRRLLTSFGWVPTDPVADFEGAARVYRSCRAAGITPRGRFDCMISSIAIRSGAELLAADQDFMAIASVVPLRVVPLD
jgi:predicted nucleic acid-binding protein